MSKTEIVDQGTADALRELLTNKALAVNLIEQVRDENGCFHLAETVRLSALGADETVMGLQPSESLLKVLVAFRAHQADDDVLVR
ncbi:MAG: hypothetical protein GC199_03520 [Alphaproteobacteria bacterium]|nr:hypothetical protein [Alphaproteobacteria bacterium]